MNFYALSSIFNIFVCSFLALAIILKKDKPHSLTYFNFFNLSILIWAIGYLFWQTSTQYQQALFWVQILMLGAIFTSPTFLLFSAQVGQVVKKLKFFIITSFLVNGIFAVLHFVATDYFITDLRTKVGINFFPTAGEYYWIFLIQWFFWFLISFYLLYRTIKISPAEEKPAIKVVFLTTLAALLFAGIFNYLPWYDINIPPVTTGVISIYGITTVLLLLKGKFYRIHLLYFEFFAILIVLLSILQFISSNQLDQWTINITIAFILLMSSFFIIRAGQRERTQLEKISLLNQSLNNAIGQIIENIEDGVLVVNKQSFVFQANNSAKNLFGYTTEYPKTFTDFVRGKINQSLVLCLQRYFSGDASAIETEISIPQHHKIKISFSPFALEEKDDAVLITIKKVV